MRTYLLALVFSLVVSGASAEPEEFHVFIKNHVFSPATIIVPANRLLFLVVENKDSSSEEFESKDLHREKIIAAGKVGRVKIGPLKAGRYTFFGAFNPNTAQGVVIAK